MQINPFGFPLGAGLQAVPPTGGPGLGFAAALGVALDGMPQRPGARAQAFVPTPALDAPVVPELMATGAKPMAVLLPGLQQPATLSQLMTTAAKLPALDAGAEPATNLPAPDVGPKSVVPSVSDVVIEPAPASPIAPPLNAPAKLAVGVAEPVVTPEAKAPAEVPESEAKPGVVPTRTAAEKIDAAVPGQTTAEAPERGTPSKAPAGAEPELEPATPRKNLRTASPAPVEAAESKPATDVVPSALLAAIPVQAPVQQQAAAQPAPVKEAAKHPATMSKARTVAPAAADAAAQPLAMAPQPEFERAIGAQGNASEGLADGDSQPLHQLKTVTAQSDIAAPAFQPAQATAAALSEAPRRVAAAAEPVIEARAGHLGQSLGVEVGRSVKMGEEELRIRLNPVELGRIEVKLAFDDNGMLQATVRAESQAALDLLRQDAPELARTLDQAGIRADAQSFRFESRADTGTGTGTGQGQQQQRGGQSHQRHAAQDDLEPAPAYRTIRGDGRVDLLA